MLNTGMGFHYWKDRTVNCLGDSITYGDEKDGGSWVELLAGSIPFRTVRKYGVSGSTITISPERNDSFYERYAQMEQDYDLTIIFGGINDFNRSLPLGQFGNQGGVTFYGALNEMIAGLLTLNPDGELMCITPMKAWFSQKDYPHWDSRNAEGHRLVDYRNAIIMVAGYYSVPVLDLFSFSGISPDCDGVKELYLSDGLHPTRAGYQRIARKIAAFIEQL